MPFKQPIEWLVTADKTLHRVKFDFQKDAFLRKQQEYNFLSNKRGNRQSRSFLHLKRSRCKNTRNPDSKRQKIGRKDNRRIKVLEFAYTYKV